MNNYPLNHPDLYKFNTRDIVQIGPNVPPRLAHVAGKRGIVLYHTDYQSGVPQAEVVMIGARVTDAMYYRKNGQINETRGGQIHTVPIEHLEKVVGFGVELGENSVLA